MALVILISTGVSFASDVNGTDSISSNAVDETQKLSVTNQEDLSVEEVPESENTNTLSTNIKNNSLVESSSEKNSTELTNATTSIYYKDSFEVTLRDSNSSAVIANKTVNFVINGVSYSDVTDSNGVAKVALSLNPGKYTATVSFAGDDDYDASQNFTSTIDILSTIQSKDLTKYYKGSTKYTATFLTTEGTSLANTDVKITVNGKTYTKKTNSKGVVSLAINLKPGTYKVVATDPVTGYKLTTTFKILSTISASDISKVYSDNKKFSAKFLKSNGKALANKYIKFKLKGKTYKVKTNSKGVAKLSVKNLKKGTYKITSYNSDGLSKTNKIKVYNKVSSSLKTSYYLFKKSDSKTIKVKLVHSLGYSPQKGKIIKIKINGKTYTKKTNSKSEVKLKLPNLKVGVYTVKYKFAGNNRYKASSATNRVAVISTSNPTLTVKSTTTFGHGAATPLKVAVTAGGVALEKRTVKFTVENKTYTKTTDKNGIASLKIKLGIGNYTVDYTVLKDSKINSKSGSVAITVKERTASSLTWKSGSTFQEGSQTIKVLLEDVNKKALSGKTVKLIVNSKTYTAKTASNGIATFKLSLSHGSYNADVKFEDNSYVANSTSHSITVNVKSVKGINEVNTISDLSAYLKSSKNCQVGNSKIKKLVDSLTKGLTSAKQKANAIFEYVRDTLSYSFYYDTKYGAVGALDAKRGNCVDHSHLLVAMFRTAGLPARYVHGECTFSSGSTYGHVWAQVLIGNTWTVADATSSRNSLGKVANWNTKTYSYEGKYVSLSF
ncbi:transglutaminase domain-containing protein [Methanobrevibacter sp.]